MQLMNLGYVKQRELESKLGSDLLRAVSLRRMHISSSSKIPLEDLPFRQFDYSLVSLFVVRLPLYHYFFITISSKTL